MPSGFHQAGAVKNCANSVRPQSKDHSISWNKEGWEAEECEICGISDEEDEEEAIKAKVIQRGSQVKMPSEAEFDERMISHYPFRSWCPHCVKGKANAAAHRNRGVKDHDHPTIHFDYCFPIKRQQKESEEEYIRKRGSPILVMYDDTLGRIMASYVREKGINPKAVEVLKEFVEESGHK